MKNYVVHAFKCHAVTPVANLHVFCGGSWGSCGEHTGADKLIVKETGGGLLQPLNH